MCKLKKQPCVNVFQNRCSYKFRNIYKKTPGLKSLCNKVAGLKAFQNDEEMSLLVFF